MMKNKIAIGLGLVLSLAAGACLANSLGGSPGEVNQGTPFTLDLKNKLEMAPGKYYTVTCQLNNVHSSKSLKAQVELKYGSWSPLTMNGIKMDRSPTNARAFEASLQDGMNTLVMSHVHPGNFTQAKEVPVTKTRTVEKEFTVKGAHWWSHNIQEKRLVEETYTDHETVSATYDDQLGFFAIDEKINQLGTGYTLDNCEAKEESAPAPVIASQPTDSPTASTIDVSGGSAPSTDVSAPTSDVSAPTVDTPPSVDAAPATDEAASS